MMPVAGIMHSSAQVAARASPLSFLRQQFVQDMPTHIGEAAVCAIVPHCKPGVVDTPKVQNGSVHIVDRRSHPVGGLEAECIGGANTDTPLDTTSQPVREAVRVVIVPLVPLRAGHAAKFGCLEHHGNILAKVKAIC